MSTQTSQAAAGDRPGTESPSVICFDATGTLIELRESVGEIYHRVALSHGVRLPAWRLDDAFRRVVRHAPPLGTEGTDLESRQQGEFAWWSERIRQTFQAADSTVRFEDFATFARALFDAFGSGSAWRVRDAIPPLIQTLRARSHRMVVISNFDHRLPQILKDLDLDTFFDAIFLPAQVGAAKPERPLFDHAAEHLDVPLSQLTYLGDDSEQTLATMASYGIRAFDIRVLESLSPLPDPIESAAVAVPAADSTD